MKKEQKIEKNAKKNRMKFLTEKALFAAEECGYTLTKKEELEFIRHGGEEVLKKYLQNRTLCKKSQVVLVQFRREMSNYAYTIDATCFTTPEEQISLFCSDNTELIKRFIEQCKSICEKAEIEFINIADYNLFIHYLEHQTLSAAGELALVKKNDFSKIRLFIKQSCFNNDQAEVEFIHTKDDEALEYYLKNYTLSDASEFALVGISRLKRIYPYINRYQLNPQAEVRLVQGSITNYDKKVVDYYCNRYQLCDEAKSELAKRKDCTLINKDETEGPEYLL